MKTYLSLTFLCVFLGLDLGLLVPALISAKDTLINSLGLFTIILTPYIMVLWIKLTFKKKQIKNTQDTKEKD